MRYVTTLACVLLAWVSQAQQNVGITVRHAPYVVSSVSSKTEIGHAPCKYCGTWIRYDRTYKWDVYNHVWNETTRNVPDTCRKCATGDRSQEKLNRRERELDRKIEYLEAKKRIESKERQVQRLRKMSR